jgi:AcrR family transcriptional regulator
VTTSSRPGGRSARVRAAVRDATLAELADKGFAGLTVEGVAARSGVHKTTVYRRWANVGGLVADALELAVGEPWPIPDTGGIEGDLTELARLVATGFTDPSQGPVASAFVSAGAQDAGAARALHAFYLARHEQSAVIVSRAVARGELPPRSDPAEVVRATVAPLFYRLFISREPVDDAVAVRAAAAALAAARAGVFTTPARPGRSRPADGAGRAAPSSAGTAEGR